jgi:signal transduction histidine kinase
LTIQEEERRRVARDLHDSVGQKLSGIKFMVEAALGAPWPDERRSGIEQLRSLIPTIQDAVEEVRCISTALRPSILDDLGLLPTIDWHFREFGKMCPDIRVEKRLEVRETDVPAGLRTPIFRILQEASNNVAKHSRATHLNISLKVKGDSLFLRVHDDGIGFEQAATQQADLGGSGLSSMRERVELSGGSFSMSSVPDEGTTLEASWSLSGRLSG